MLESQHIQERMLTDSLAISAKYASACLSILLIRLRLSKSLKISSIAFHSHKEDIKRNLRRLSGYVHLYGTYTTASLPLKGDVKSRAGPDYAGADAEELPGGGRSRRAKPAITGAAASRNL